MKSGGVYRQTRYKQTNLAGPIYRGPAKIPSSCPQEDTGLLIQLSNKKS